MKYYSEKLNKMFDTMFECKRAEIEAEQVKSKAEEKEVKPETEEEKSAFELLRESYNEMLTYTNKLKENSEVYRKRCTEADEVYGKSIKIAKDVRNKETNDAYKSYETTKRELEKKYAEYDEANINMLKAIFTKGKDTSDKELAKNCHDYIFKLEDDYTEDSKLPLFTKSVFDIFDDFLFR